MTDVSDLPGRRVVVAGATSESGAAVCAALVAGGATVLGIGSSAEKLAALAARVPGVETVVCDLSDSAAVDELAGALTTAGGVDGLVHLVGGWVGGRGIPGQTDEAWAAMERGFRTLRNTTRAFYPALVASPAGRVAFVSSASVDAPTASGASYTASKAASESWMRSVAQGFRADQGGDARAAAVVFVVTALVDESMRAAAPEKSFDGFTDVGVLAGAVVELWSGERDAGGLNGSRIRL
ncbi:SDR family oxidoreductase [Herbiconiux moechotypicola]|uniref:Oxidoreductase n=1 Tax=Herbiconiux moechotypicola TaxID=637393 RepID=A0ABN3DA86_9MICO|nr:SDR family oxidoreductase [Herbiconiux moechotypicola]MCS5729051.1 SDR family oxidoreductase [Herbiconiux moechotypicola]